MIRSHRVASALHSRRASFVFASLLTALCANGCVIEQAKDSNAGGAAGSDPGPAGGGSNATGGQSSGANGGAGQGAEGGQGQGAEGGQGAGGDPFAGGAGGQSSGGSGQGAGSGTGTGAGGQGSGGSGTGAAGQATGGTTGGAGTSSGCATQRIDLGTKPVSVFDHPTFELQVPPGTQSFSYTVWPGPGQTASTFSLIAPDGTVFVDAENDTSKFRTGFPAKGNPYTALFPNATGLLVQPGTWKVSLWAGADANAKVDAFIKPTCAGKAHIPLTLWFTKHTVPAGKPLSAATALSDPTMQKAFARMRALYAGTAGDGPTIDASDIDVHDLSEVMGNDAANHTVIDDEAELLAVTDALAATPMKGIPLVFIEKFSMWPDTGGYSLVLPGPPSAPGVHTSAVFVLVSPEFWDNPLTPDAMGDLMSHETGHYLGLFHSTEQSGDNHDPIADTPECTAVDAAGKHTADVCGDAGKNVMFWGGYESLPFTPGQLAVVKGHPMVTTK